MSVFVCYQAFRLTDSKKNVYTDNHSGISARQRDSNVSMTNLVSAEDDVTLRVSTGLSAAIDEGCRMTIICLCMSSGPPPLDDKRVQNDHIGLCVSSGPPPLEDKRV